MCVLFAALFQLEPSSFAFRTFFFFFFPPKERHNVGLLPFDDDHDHICYRLRRFKFLAEKVMSSNHYNFIHKFHSPGFQAGCHHPPPFLKKVFSRIRCLSMIHFLINGWRGRSFSLRAELIECHEHWRNLLLLL
jgi:hypothetical protein